MMMMMIRSTTTAAATTTTTDTAIPTPPFPTWKLYENPFFTCPTVLQNQSKNPTPTNHQNHTAATFEKEEEEGGQKRILHRLHLPVSSRKIAASFWDLAFIKPFMEPDTLESARAEIIELKSQLEYERKARRKLEAANKKLAKEADTERKGRDALEKAFRELALEISLDKAEITRLRREMEEERKMLRVSEVLREERVQMKLSEAKMLLEEKLLELEAIKKVVNPQPKYAGPVVLSSADQDHRSGTCERVKCQQDVLLTSKNGGVQAMVVQKKASLEPENPHIKRGIKGFVEFPKVVRAIGMRSRHLGNKLECQRAQLMIMLKHKGTPIRSNNLIIS